MEIKLWSLVWRWKPYHMATIPVCMQHQQSVLWYLGQQYYCLTWCKWIAVLHTRTKHVMRSELLLVLGQDMAAFAQWVRRYGWGLNPWHLVHKTNALPLGHHTYIKEVSCVIENKAIANATRLLIYIKWGRSAVVPSTTLSWCCVHIGMTAMWKGVDL